MRSKRFVISIVALVAIVLVTIAGCTPETAPTPTPTPTPSPSPTPTQPTAEKYVWNLQASYSEASYLSETAIRFAQEISVATGGQMEVRFFGAGGIAPATEEFDAVSANAIQMALTAFGYTQDKFPNGVILDAKPGTMSHLAARMWWDSYGGIEFANEMIAGHGVTVLHGPLVKTPEPFLCTGFEINSLADLQGKRLRAYGDAGVILDKLGAAVLFLPGGETYESMQRGVIDGFELGTPAGDFQAATYEVIDYMYLGEIRSPYSIGPYYVNTQQWNALPEHLQATIQNTLSAVTDKWNGELLIRDLEALEGFRDYGTIIRPIPRDVWEATEVAIDEMYADARATDPFAARVLDNLAEFERMFNEALSLHRAE